MARHEVVIHENTSATKESAPYLGSYIAKETIALAQFASAVGLKCGLPAIQVIAILGGSFEAIEELEREALVRVHTDLGVICGVITGSFPTADAAFDPVRNSLELALRLDEAIRLDLTDAVPVIVTDENVTRLRVDNVMDLEEERPMNLIHGRHVFRVAGFNMVLGDEGATAFLQNALGTTFPLVIDEVVSKQLFKAHTAELLPGGDYKLVVKSRAGDAYLRVEDPVPADPPTATSYVADMMEGEPIYVSSGRLTVNGTNLADATKVQLSYTEGGEAFYEMPVTETTETSASGTCGYTGSLTYQTGYLRVVTPNGTSNELACAFNP